MAGALAPEFEGFGQQRRRARDEDAKVGAGLFGEAGFLQQAHVIGRHAHHDRATRQQFDHAPGVELGQESYAASAKLNGHPASGIAIQLATGADALKTAAAVKERVAELSKDLPAGYAITYPRDTTDFVKLSIKEVIKTIFEAAILVLGVVFLFLQTWRATLIPMIAVPVSLIGAFAGLWAVGFTINTLTLFALVLAIGIVVDDAIVVLENVERLMREEKMGSHPARRGNHTFLSSGDVEWFAELGRRLLGPELMQAGHWSTH